jgi:hypothetical protein
MVDGFDVEVDKVTKKKQASRLRVHHAPLSQDGTNTNIHKQAGSDG